MTNNRFNPQFTPDCTKRETVLGLIWLAIHMFALPLLIPTLQVHLFSHMTDIAVNAVYYCVSLLAVLLFGMGMLRREFDHLMDRPFHCLRSFLVSYCLWYGLSMLMVSVLMLLGLDSEVPNDMAVDMMAEQNYNLTLFISVICAPILEEILFRGVLFQTIRRHSRLWAYTASIGLFGLYHVWQFALIYQDPMYLLYALQYIPITYALTWCYEHSGSLWTPIFFHATNNLLAMQVVQMM